MLPPLWSGAEMTKYIWQWVRCLCATALAGCAPVAQSGVFKMEVNHRGKPVCAFYLPSDQDADDSIQMRFASGPCPDTIIDQPISAEPRQ